MATLGADPAQRDALVAGVDGQAQPGCRKSTIGRIWKAFELKPHLVDGFKISQRSAVRGQGRRRRRALPRPARRRRWCCAWTRRSQIQALDRSQPVLPMMPGHARAAHPRLRAARHHQPVRGVQHRRRDRDLRSSTAATAPSSSRSSSPRSTAQVPDDLDVHLVCDNYGTHKTPAITKWLAAPPPVPHALHPDLLVAGSTRSNAGSRYSPTRSCAAAPTAASRP